MKRWIGAVLVVLFLVAGGLWAWKWVSFRRKHVVSNAVFVESETFAKVAFKGVSGRIVKTYKEEGDWVEEGELLAKMEDEDYRIKLKGVEHEIKALEERLKALLLKKERVEKETLVREESLKVEEKRLKEKVKAFEVKVRRLERDYGRFKRLYEKGVVPARKYEEVETALLSAKRELEALRLALKELEKKRELVKVGGKVVKEIEKEAKALKEKLSALKKKREELLRLLSYTELRSPMKGFVVKKFLKEGELARPGQFVYAVFNPEGVYVLVLLDERKLKGVKVGNKVKIKIDAYPDEEYEGVVKEINKAVASKFAIIPRDVTAGEFTKVAQRVPIKIEITKGDKSKLVLGMGGEVAIEKSP